MALPAVQRIRKRVRQLVESVIDEHVKIIRADLADKLEGELQGIIEESLGLGVPAAGKQASLRSEAKRLAASVASPRKKATKKKATKKKATKKKATKKKVAKKAAKKKATAKKATAKKAAGKKRAAKKTRSTKGSAGFEELKAKLKAKRSNGVEQTCGVSGCSKPVRSMGYCASDYQNARNNDWPMPCPDKFDAPKRKRGRPKTDDNGATAEATA